MPASPSPNRRSAGERWSLVLIGIINVIPVRLWKLFINIGWYFLVWDVVVPISRGVLVFFIPHAAIQSWSYYRQAFCLLWLQLIRSEVVLALEGLDWQIGEGVFCGEKINTLIRAGVISVVLKGKCVFKATIDGQVRRRVVVRSGRALGEAAEKTRGRLSGELNSISIVSVLLASINFVALLISGEDVFVSEGRKDCERENLCSARRMFIACAALALLFSVLLTGMFATISTLLNLCPERKAILWFLWRFEPAIGLMHLLLIFTLLFTALAGGSYVWVLSSRYFNAFQFSIAGIAGACLLYYLYFIGKGYSSRTHGLVGVVDWKPIQRIDFEVEEVLDFDLNEVVKWKPQTEIDLCNFSGEFTKNIKFLIDDENKIQCWVDNNDKKQRYPILLDSALRSILELEFMNVLSDQPFAVWKRADDFLKTFDNGMAQYDIRHACPGQNKVIPDHPAFTCATLDDFWCRRKDGGSSGGEPLIKIQVPWWKDAV